MAHRIIKCCVFVSVGKDSHLKVLSIIFIKLDIGD